jgi:hypothetical protein
MGRTAWQRRPISMSTFPTSDELLASLIERSLGVRQLACASALAALSSPAPLGPLRVLGRARRVTLVEPTLAVFFPISRTMCARPLHPIPPVPLAA